MLKHAVQRVTRHPTVELITDDHQLQRVLTAEALLLVNRVLDGAFSLENGIDLIRELAGRDEGPRFMLVSNFEQSQAEAIEAGAYPGFGKQMAGQPAMQQRLEAAINGSASNQ